MRLKVKKMPEHNAKREIKTFLWLPKKIDYEWRWLENADITQRYNRRRFDWGWKDEAWGN
jgi:hypothetical protein